MQKEKSSHGMALSTGKLNEKEIETVKTVSSVHKFLQGNSTYSLPSTDKGRKALHLVTSF